jgi:hypothetical protein
MRPATAPTREVDQLKNEGREHPGPRSLYAGHARTLGGGSPPWRRWHQPQAKGNCVAVRRGGKEAGGETATRGTRIAFEAGRPGRAGKTRQSPLPSSGRHVNAAGVRGRCPGLSREPCRDVGLDACRPTPAAERQPVTRQESAEAVVAAGSCAAKGRTRSRGKARPCSRKPQQPTPLRRGLRAMDA